METSLEKIYLTQLSELFNCEKQLSEALPKLLISIRTKELRLAISNHIEDTRNHVSRLVTILEIRSKEKAIVHNCRIIEDLLAEISRFSSMGEINDEAEVSIINLLQKVEHFEIAAYSSAVTYSKMMGYDPDSELLQKTLDEEYEADNKLDKISEEVLDVLLKT
ncbi:MAG: ferritin-like domain-containing protein [Cytophagaceae bacterium]